MIVCACAVVRAHEIEQHVTDGADTVEQVGSVCGAGSHCGGCRAAIARLVAARDSATDTLVALSGITRAD